MVDNLRESTERYHTLVEATTEGTLLVLDDRCRYANPTFLSMLGYTAAPIGVFGSGRYAAARTG